MATRSMIGMTLPDGSIKVVYCHWDGYPSNNGVILRNHYNTVEKIEALMSLGDMSSLRENLGEKHDMNDLHDTTARDSGWCSFYGRDRDEEGQDARIVKDNRQFLSIAQGAWVDWMYLFDSHYNEWLAKKAEEGEPYRKLVDILIEEGLIDPIEQLLNTAKQD